MPCDYGRSNGSGTTLARMSRAVSFALSDAVRWTDVQLRPNIADHNTLAEQLFNADSRVLSRTDPPNPMKVRDAINADIPALEASDTVEEALGTLMDHHLPHLPVVDEEGDLAGVLSEERLMDAEGPDTPIGDLMVGRPVSVPPEAHIFEAARAMVDHDLGIIPVADQRGHYYGLVQRHDVFDTFAQMLSTQQSGAIVALEVDQRDYALGRLVRLIEQNEGKVLAVASEEPDQSTDKIRVTLKLNVRDTSRIRHVLEHNGYHVVASFGETEEEIEDLVEEFVRYLEV